MTDNLQDKYSRIKDSPNRESKEYPGLIYIYNLICIGGYIFALCGY